MSEEKNFKIGDTVYQSIDPEYTTAFTPALECEVVGICEEVRRKGEVITDYIVDYHSLEGEHSVNPEKLFTNRQEAIAYSKKSLSEKIDNLKERLSKYESLFADLDNGEVK